MMPSTPDRREHDMETALRLQSLEMQVSELTKSLAANTALTQKLVTAWEGSNATLSFVKASAMFGAAVIAIIAGISKLLGH